MEEFWKSLGALVGTIAGALGAYVGLKNYIDRKKKERKDFYDSLATKEQVERHKKANDDNVDILREEMDKRLSSQDRRLENIESLITDMPLRIVEVLKENK